MKQFHFSHVRQSLLVITNTVPKDLFDLKHHSHNNNTPQIVTSVDIFYVYARFTLWIRTHSTCLFTHRCVKPYCIHTVTGPTQPLYTRQRRRYSVVMCGFLLHSDLMSNFCHVVFVVVLLHSDLTPNRWHAYFTYSDLMPNCCHACCTYSDVMSNCVRMCVCVCMWLCVCVCVRGCLYVCVARGVQGRREPDVKGPEDNKADSMVGCLASWLGRLVGCLQYGTSGSRVLGGLSVGWLVDR